MKLRLIGVAMVVAALAVSASGCGRYSISNIRSLKAFQDANNLYKKGEYKSAIERYEASLKFNPELGFAYFFLGNSYDNLYKSGQERRPGKRRQPHEGGRQLSDRHPEDGRHDGSQGEGDPKPRVPVPHRGLRGGKARRFQQSRADCQGTDRRRARRAGQLSGAGEDVRRPRALRRSRGHVPEGRSSCGQRTASGYQLLAAFYNRQGNFDKTMEAHYQRAAAEPNNPEAWHTIGGFYQDKVFRDKKLPAKVALDYTIKGLEAEDKALQLNPEYFEALSFKNILLRQQALYEKDPAVQKRLITRGRRVTTRRRSRCRRSRTRAPRPPPQPQPPGPARRATSRTSPRRRQGAAGERWPRLFPCGPDFL